MFKVPTALRNNPSKGSVTRLLTSQMMGANKSLRRLNNSQLMEEVRRLPISILNSILKILAN